MSNRRDRTRAAKLARRRRRVDRRRLPGDGLTIDFSDYWEEAIEHLAPVIDPAELSNLFQRTMDEDTPPAIPPALLEHMAGCERCQAEDAWGLGPGEE